MRSIAASCAKSQKYAFHRRPFFTRFCRTSLPFLSQRVYSIRIILFHFPPSSPFSSAKAGLKRMGGKEKGERKEYKRLLWEKLLFPRGGKSKGKEKEEKGGTISIFDMLLLSNLFFLLSAAAAAEVVRLQSLGPNLRSTHLFPPPTFFLGGGGVCASFLPTHCLKFVPPFGPFILSFLFLFRCRLTCFLKPSSFLPPPSLPPHGAFFFLPRGARRD